MTLLTRTIREALLRNGRVRQQLAVSDLVEPDFLPVVRLFTPDANCTWLLTELDPDDPDIAFGLCDLGMGFPELGGVRISELETVRGGLGLPVERDLHFTATKPISAYADEARAAGCISGGDAPPEQESCEQRVEAHLRGRIADLSHLWAAHCEGRETVDDLGSLYEYGLCFDYVAPETFEGQKEGYFRYQLSWGGPSDEFRFFVGPDMTCHRTEYWFLDWFDGAHRVLDGETEALLSELWEWFNECGSAQAALNKALED